ncbi:MAG: DUF1631 family protein [Methylobacter sp.]|nr:DUF1631 family protein [Methylobacter sp.]
MTNYLINKNENIAMDNKQQINSALTKAKRTEILEKIKSVFFQHFEQVVEDCCMRIDLDFGSQLGRNRGKMSKEQYIKLLEYLHSVRKEIKKNYLLKVSASFDEGYQITLNSVVGMPGFSNLSLISDDLVIENQNIALIIGQCQNLFYEELASLNKYLATSSTNQSIVRSKIPLFPDKLIQNLVEVIKPLQLNSEGRIALYKIFEANVFMQLGFIYRELIKLCEQTEIKQDRDINIPKGKQLGHLSNYIVGEINEEIELIQVTAEKSSDEFQLLQQKLGQWRLSHSPSVYDLTPAALDLFYEHFEIKNALQILQQFKEDNEPYEKKLPLKWRVLKKLKELSFSDKANNLTRQDEDTLDLVALIFNAIEQDECLDYSLKIALLKLEIPMASVSLGRYSVFTNQGNPVRQLLDDLYSAGLFLNVAKQDDQLILARIEYSINKMIKESGSDFSSWHLEAEVFSGYIIKQNLHNQEIEKSIREMMRNFQSLEELRKIIEEVIEKSMNGKALPTMIVDFLRDVWFDVLLAAYQSKDELPEQWLKSVQVMDELILSVVPPADDLVRKQILKILPGLILELRKGLKLISYDKSAQSRFFKDLAVWHIILMDKKEAKKTVCPISKPNLVSEKTNDFSIADESSELAKNIAEQSWVMFNLESGRLWGKLIWKDDLRDNRVFVGKNGEKLLEIKASDLGEKLRLGQAVIIKSDQKMITERVLSELTGL